MKKSNKIHEINFITSYNRKKGNDKSRFEFLKEYQALIIISIAMVVLSGASFAYMLIQKNGVDSINDQITDEKFIAEYDAATELENQNNSLIARINELDKLDKTLATYPKASSAVSNKLASLTTSSTTINITAYNANTGALTFVATSGDNMEINGFIQNLMDSKLFSNVTYSGYSYQSTNAVYSIHVQCYLAADAGRGDQSE